jgi:hypothetical protein
MVVMVVEKLRSTEELMECISSMNRDNSVCQFYIPRKGKFTLVLQEEDQTSINTEAEVNPELKRMIHESREQYKQGLGMSTSELIKSFSPKDFT